MDVPKQYEWNKKSVKYKIKYFGGLKALYGEIEDAKEIRSQEDSNDKITASGGEDPQVVS